MADEQQQAQNLNPDLAGYPDTERLVAAYRASGDEAKKQRERAEAAERRAAELESRAYAPANQRVDIPQRPADPYQQLAEYGVPPEAFRAAVRYEAGGMLQEALQPIAQGFQARNELLGQYPDYQKFESDVASHINSDPELKERYQRMFASDPVGAMDYGFLKFAESRRRQHTNGGNGIQQQQLTEAQIPSGRTGDARRFDNSGDRAQQLWERYQQTHSQQDAQAFAKARLKMAIPDEFLNQ